MTLQPPLIKSDRRRMVLATAAEARLRLRDWDVDEDDVLNLIDSGFLLAWNIALDPRSSARLWRIFPDSIDHFEKTGGSRPFSCSDSKISQRLFEGQSQIITTRELANFLNCGPDHIINLYDMGAFGPAKRDYDRGNGAAFTRAAITKFLSSRLEGAL